MTHVTFGEVPPKKPPSRETLLAEQADLKQRSEQIKYVLSHMPSADYQRQELESELIAIQGMAAANAAVLDPKKADPEMAERQRLEAESRAEMLRKMAAAHAEPSADELATRRANAAERRRILLDQFEQEAVEKHMAMIEQYEKTGLFREAKLQRLELLAARPRFSACQPACVTARVRPLTARL